MGLQKHSKVLNDTVEMLSDEGSYHQLFHAYRDEEALPSGEVLKEIIDLCRAILFPGYYGNARISKQTIRFHTGVNVGTLHTLLSKQIYAGLCFADTACVSCPEEKILTEAENCRKPLSVRFPKCAPCWRRMPRLLSTVILLLRTSTKLFLLSRFPGCLQLSYCAPAIPVGRSLYSPHDY